MANSQGLEVAIGQGIELAPTRPQFQEHSVPGMEVVEHSNLEVVTPRQGLSQTKTWEKTSGLPEPHTPYLTGHDYGQQRHHRQGSRQTEPGPGPGHIGTGPHGTPLTSYSSIAPPYGFNSPYDHQPLVPPSAKGGGGRGGGGAPFSQRERICGLKRQTFWIVLAIVIFLVVVGAAAGVGVGVATSRKSSDTSTSVPTPVKSASTTTVTTTASTSTRTLPVPTASAVTGGPQIIDCPFDNLTLYTPQNNNSRQFLLLCGHDYNENEGSVDLSNMVTVSMDDCINLCATQSECVGAGWGISNVGQTTCWLKSSLATSNNSPLWYFAIDDTGDSVPTRGS